jgi:hypothetical protein
MNDKVHRRRRASPVPQYPAENDVYMPTSACPFRSKKFIENRDARMMGIWPLEARISVFGPAMKYLPSPVAKSAYPKSYPDNVGYEDTTPLQRS